MLKRSMMVLLALIPVVLSAAQYGNAQNKEFTEAMAGTSELSSEDKAFMDAVVPQKMFNRYYTRAHLSLAGYGAEIGFTLSPSTKELTKSSATGSFGFKSLALGYQWQNSAFELEYFKTKSFSYNPDPLIVGIAASKLVSDVKTKGILLNVLYFWKEKPTQLDWFKLQSYGIFGLGYGQTQLTTEFSSTDQKVVDKNGVLFDIGFGIRSRLSEHFLVDLTGKLNSWALPSGIIYTGSDTTYEAVPTRMMSATVLFGLTFMF